MNTEGYSKSETDQQKMTDAIKGCLFLFIIAVLIDLIFVFYALFCLFNSHLPWYLTTLLIVCMLYPGLGFMVSIGVIIYYHTVVLKKAVKSAPAVGENAAFYFF
jgi:uncharacterized membrane protein YdbT with pleckstrin-like domain